MNIQTIMKDPYRPPAQRRKPPPNIAIRIYMPFSTAC